MQFVVALNVKDLEIILHSQWGFSWELAQVYLDLCLNLECRLGRELLSFMNMSLPLWCHQSVYIGRTDWYLVRCN